MYYKHVYIGYIILYKIYICIKFTSTFYNLLWILFSACLKTLPNPKKFCFVSLVFCEICLAKDGSKKSLCDHNLLLCILKLLCLSAAERARPQAGRGTPTLGQVPGGSGRSGQVADGHRRDGGQSEATVRRLQGGQGSAAGAEGKRELTESVLSVHKQNTYSVVL